MGYHKTIKQFCGDYQFIFAGKVLGFSYGRGKPRNLEVLWRREHLAGFFGVSENILGCAFDRRSVLAGFAERFQRLVTGACPATSTVERDVPAEQPVVVGRDGVGSAHAAGWRTGMI
jgi:hypothetical protein